eukprot:1189712-Prorocentrum_minimum.AAC.1
MSQHFLLYALVSFANCYHMYNVSHLAIYLIPVRVHPIPPKSQPQWKVPPPGVYTDLIFTDAVRTVWVWGESQLRARASAPHQQQRNSHQDDAGGAIIAGHIGGAYHGGSGKLAEPHPGVTRRNWMARSLLLVDWDYFGWYISRPPLDPL